MKKQNYFMVDFSILYKFLLLSLFLTLFLTTYPKTLVQSKEEIASNVERELELLRLKQSQLESFKGTLLSSGIDIKDVTTLQNRDLKIALVLSGGGAKGAAHVGVLKVLEEHKIPIDIVIGTSVGSIVGGMYSLGYSPDKIEKFITEMDFTSLISNGDSLDPNNIQENLASSKYPLSVDLDGEFKPTFPMGLVNGEKVYLLLKDIFSIASKYKSFDEFPIKYRAVSTKVSSGKENVSHEGDLALEVLKSMAIPTAIEPIKDGDEFYIDGGVVNNFPVDVAISMGADIIIGVDITADTTKINEKSNIASIVNKISTYNGNQNTQRNKSLADILIVPEVKNHSTLDFSNLSNLVDEGERAANLITNQLQSLSNESKWKSIKESSLLGSSLSGGQFKISEIELQGNSLLTLNEVKRVMPRGEDGLLSSEELIQWSDSIYNIEYVSRVFYEINGEKITFKIEEYENKRVNFGFNYSSNLGASFRTQLSSRTLKSPSNSVVLDLTLNHFPDLIVRDRLDFSWRNRRYVAHFHGGYRSNQLLLWRESNRESIFASRDVFARLGITTSLSENTLIGIASEYQWSENKYSSGSDRYNHLQDGENYLESSLLLSYSTLDSDTYPSKGNSLYSEASLSSNNIKSIYSYGKSYFPLSEVFTLGLLGGYGEIIGSNIPLNKYLKVGGIRNDNKNRGLDFYGLPSMHHISREFYYAGINGIYKLNKFVHLNFRYNYGIAHGNHHLGYSDREKLIGYGIGVGIDSFIGPLDFIITNNIYSNSPLFQFYIGYEF